MQWPTFQCVQAQITHEQKDEKITKIGADLTKLLWKQLCPSFLWFTVYYQADGCLKQAFFVLHYFTVLHMLLPVAQEHKLSCIWFQELSVATVCWTSHQMQMSRTKSRCGFVSHATVAVADKPVRHSGLSHVQSLSTLTAMTSWLFLIIIK